MSSTAATQTSTTGTPAASGGASGATGGQSATDSSPAAGAAGATKSEAGGADDGKQRTSVLGEGGADGKSASAGAEGKKEGDGQGQAGAAGELEIKLPDGLKIDAEQLAAFTGVAKDAAKEAGLTNGEQVSKLLSKIATWDAERQAKAASDMVASWEKQDDGWVAELQKDPEIGGEKFDASKMAAQRAVRRFGGDELRRDLIHHGIGNLPSLVRAFAKIGLAIGEDTTTGGGAGAGKTAGAPVTREERAVAFYDSITPKGGKA